MQLKDELRTWVGKEIGSLAKPDDIRFTDSLPKTRSGKIMRRLLRELAAGGEVRGDVYDARRPERIGETRALKDSEATCELGMSIELSC